MIYIALFSACGIWWVGVCILLGLFAVAQNLKGRAETPVTGRNGRGAGEGSRPPHNTL